MAINYIPLDKDKHSDLKVLPKINFEYSKDTHLAAATIREFAQLAGTMPIFFIEDPSSKNVHTVAMLGIEQGKNLFWADETWNGPHVPLNIQRYPFDIRPDGEKLGVFIDENSDFISEQGEALFTAEGEPTEYLKNRQQFLAELANSEMLNQRFIAKVVELDLLEPVQIGVQYEAGQSRNITGINAISEKKLHELSDDVIVDLHKQGFLGAIYAMLLSLGQLNRLVELSAKTDMAVRALQLRPSPTEEQAQNA